MEMAVSVRGGDMVKEHYVCPICCEVFKSPVIIQTCGHMFCAVCIEQVLPNPDHSRSCPVCRVAFSSRDIRHHSLLQQDIAATTIACTTCGAKCALSSWDEHTSIAHPHMQAVKLQPDIHHLHKSAPPTSNRSTFSCPLCSERNLSCSDLLAHVNSVHQHSKTPVVCPVCASMPWGVADQVSQNFVGHLNARHKFEYDTYVDYDADEEATLQVTLQASLNDK